MLFTIWKSKLCIIMLFGEGYIMTPKQRLLAAIKGEASDRLPWSPFLAYFWEDQPLSVQDMGQLRFLEEMGADPLLRGFQTLWKPKRTKCTVVESVDGNEKQVVYETPVGSLKERYVYTPAGNTWFLMEHAIKTEDDFKVLTYIYEDLKVLPHVKDFAEEHRSVGERAMCLPVIGTEGKTCFQSMVEHWVGTEELVYSLMDYPEAVEECLAVMQKKAVETVRISAESPAEAFIFWEDSSTTNISPAYFEKYAMPEISNWSEILHDAGKYLVHHACGHLKALLPLMAQTGVDMIESVSPPPTGNVELWEAREILPQNIGLVGGIEPTVFLNSNMEELDAYVRKLIEKMQGARFILANSDSCPPGVACEKFKRVTDIVKWMK